MPNQTAEEFLLEQARAGRPVLERLYCREGGLTRHFMRRAPSSAGGALCGAGLGLVAAEAAHPTSPICLECRRVYLLNLVSKTENKR